MNKKQKKEYEQDLKEMENTPNKWLKWIDRGLIITLILLAIWIYIDGAHISKEFHIIETCGETILTNISQYGLNITIT